MNGFGVVWSYVISTNVVYLMFLIIFYTNKQFLGGNTPQNHSCTATYHPSRNLSKLGEQDTRDTAGKVRTNSYAIYSSGLLHMGEQR